MLGLRLLVTEHFWPHSGTQLVFFVIYQAHSKGKLSLFEPDPAKPGANRLDQKLAVPEGESTSASRWHQ